MSANSNRSAGVLMHLTSLPGPGPIGAMGKQAYDFIDFLEAAGQKIWQILPLTPPARGNSPYSPLGAFAGNPFLIDIPQLEKQKLLLSGSVARYEDFPANRVDFDACERVVMPLLRLCHKENGAALAGEVAAFRARQRFWLEDYALFMALRTHYGNKNYLAWPTPLLRRESEALARAREEHADEVDFWIFSQYLFFSQWSALREYANRRGVRVFGDMPIYVDRESADLWAHGALFLLDKNLRPAFVAGVPPDAFSSDGQLWGSPLYDWEAMKNDGYAWWLMRLGAAADIYDMIRIDHFRALESYWAIPAGEKKARHGSWRKGPGIGFLDAMRAGVPGCVMVAEDLGLLTDDVRKLLRQSGLPGVSVMLFAFKPWERSSYLPHNMERNRIAYIGTHDNDTAIGWLDCAPAEETQFARSYLNLNREEGEHWGFIRALYASVADTAIVQMQDLLGLGNEARINIPSKEEGNWGWRLAPGLLTSDLARKMREFASLYHRC